MRGAAVVLGLIAMLDASNAQERWQARSMVVTTRGIVATSQTLASQAGAQVLARGGSAVDAALAANAVLGVVEPMSNGIGGDLFAMVRDAKTGHIQGLNSSGPAPRGLSIEFLKQHGEKSMPALGIHTVTVPGCVRGWAVLHQRYGKLPWADVLAPAIYIAEHGFPVTELIAQQWLGARRKLQQDADAQFALPGGQPPAFGAVFRNPGLARALRTIAKEGPDAFYRGEIAAALLAKSEQLGGTMTSPDLASYQPEWVEPLSTTYRGWSVYELPPNSQGLAALSMLNLMELFDLPKMDPLGALTLHHEIEAQKLAYADLHRYVADPRQAHVPVRTLIDKNYAKKRAALIDPAQANCMPEPGAGLESEGDTIYMAAVDADGNLVSLIQSLYQGFGSGVAVPGYGFHLQNRGALFTLDEKHPNALAPGKRPFHTIIPAMMERGDRHIAFGIMGGLNQAQAHAQFVSRVADHSMNLQQALEAPRFTRPEFEGCRVLIEDRVPPHVMEALRKLGHDVRVVGSYSMEMGGGQATEFNTATGVKSAGSSPRKDGAAIPEPDPYFPR